MRRPAALADLIALVAHIAHVDPEAAQALKAEIEFKVAKLPNYPKLYKASPRVKGMRELVVRSNYVVLYRETPELVEVAGVFHARRQLPPLK